MNVLSLDVLPSSKSSCILLKQHWSGIGALTVKTSRQIAVMCDKRLVTSDVKICSFEKWII